jgi:hypothetical protein
VNLVTAIGFITRLDTRLRYTWPSLLDLPPNHGHFFGPIIDAIKNGLQQESVLESEAGDLRKPVDLLRVPPELRFGGVECPIPTTVAKEKFLSSKYDQDLYHKPLKDLGVNDLSTFDLRRHIRDYAGTAAGKQDTGWHEKLAKLILEPGSGLRGYCKDLKLIPVLNNRNEHDWVAASDRKKIFLSTELAHSNQNPLPRGIDLLCVPATEHRNEHRRRLFAEEFGVQDMMASILSIASQLVSRHQYSWWSQDLTKEDLISHAKFLFRHRDCRPPPVFWVFTQSGKRQRASETFAEPLLAAGVHLPTQVLHEDYTKGEPAGGEELLRWMKFHLNMPRVPRLVIPDGDEAYSLSPEIKFIVEKVGSFEFLDLLRQNWSLHYRAWLRGQNAQLQQKILDHIASTTIRCQDSANRPLKDAIFPAFELELPNSITMLPLLPIPKELATPDQWKFLADLGVQPQPTVKNCIECLKRLKAEGNVTQPKPHASRGQGSYWDMPVMVEAASILYKLLEKLNKEPSQGSSIR